MKSWKLTMALLGAAVALAALGTLVGAAEHGERDVARTVARMKERLALSDAQAAQVETILREAQVRAQADRESAGEDREKLRELTRARRRDTQQRIGAILTDEQKEKARSARRGGRRARPSPSPEPSPLQS